MTIERTDKDYNDLPVIFATVYTVNLNDFLEIFLAQQGITFVLMSKIYFEELPPT